MKICKNCNEELELTNFNKRHNICKKCTYIKSLCIHDVRKTYCKTCNPNPKKIAPNVKNI
jgi:hypothetical protein